MSSLNHPVYVRNYVIFIEYFDYPKILGEINTGTDVKSYIFFFPFVVFHVGLF